MKAIIVILLCMLVVCPSLNAGAPPSGGASVALLSKVIQDVTRQVTGEEWQKATRGETLGSGDKVKTGEKSLAIIKFKDNSMVRVRQQSELTITGTVSGSSFSKSVDLSNGSFGFHVQKQKSDEEFRFTSPTSVASIRGTAGLFTSGGTSDTLVTIDGEVILTNKSSSQSASVPAGYTGIAGQDGSLQTRVSTEDEKKAAENASMTGDVIKKLELELRDGQGRTEQLRIDFSE